MTRLQAFVIVLLAWAAIYLPGLGSTELKGEEGRRIFPAITMIETGNWLVPWVGGRPFLRKPPLVNWMIAESFRVTGVRNEWAARLPSVLCMLLLAGTIVALGTGGEWMKPETALVAALMLLTQVATVEKGRLAEIEAVYFSLTGVAMVLWLACWARRAPEWLLWLGPGFFLGIATLAKGPVNLVFFYAMVIAVLWQAKEMPRLRRGWAAGGLALTLGILALWAVPFLRTPEAHDAWKVWNGQFTGRVTGKFDWAGWIMNIPDGLKNHLPWVLFAPLLWRKDFAALGERTAALFRGVRLAVVICFFGFLLVPGILPRYTLPLLGPLCCLWAFAVADERLAPSPRALRAWWRGNQILASLILLAAIAGPITLAILERRHFLLVRGNTLGDFAALLTWPIVASSLGSAVAIAALVGRWKLARPSLIASASAFLIGAGICIYGGTVVPMLKKAEKLRPMAAAIDAAVPPGERLCLFDPEYQPVLFYLRHPIFYTLDVVPPETAWVLVPNGQRGALQARNPQFEVLGKYPENRHPPLLLLLRRAGG